MTTRRNAAKVFRALGGLVVLVGVSWLCARRALGEAPAGRYEVTADEVHDTQTSLTWKRTEEPSAVSAATAATLCKSPWRLPSVRELYTLVDPTIDGVPGLSATIDPVFFGPTPESPPTAWDFWTSTPVARSVDEAWFVQFGGGNTYWQVRTNDALVRCVRDP